MKRVNGDREGDRGERGRGNSKNEGRVRGRRVKGENSRS